MKTSRFRTALAAFALLAVMAGCTTLPPGADFPRAQSVALEKPETTAIGRQIAARVAGRNGLSGFKLLPRGIDSFALRAQMADAAERTLDLQYFIIQNDDSGYLLMDALLRAAKRGVKVRLLIDDPQAQAQEAQITALAAHPNIDIRLFNPFAYRGGLEPVRWLELAFSAPRLNHRMHNKLFVVDNSIAIAGGRNLGDPYFESGKDLHFGDYDAFAMGPAVQALSVSFDKYWNSGLSVNVHRLFGATPPADALPAFEQDLAAHRASMKGTDLERHAASGQPLKGLLEAGSGVVWAKAEVIYDSPDKADVDDGNVPGRLIRRKLIEASRAATTELVVVSPYFVPGEPGVKMLSELRDRGVRVRVLTNSLASTDEPIVHSGYQKYRLPLLEEGVQIYEVKPLPGKLQEKGDVRNASAGQFALHAKVFVIDRKRIFIGSANFDRRSFHLNTEVGLLIDSPELARQVVERFDAIASPANSYVLSLTPQQGGAAALTWRSEEEGRTVVSTVEPGADRMREFKVDLLSLLPLDDLL